MDRRWKRCFPGVLSDNCDAPANLLRHFYGCLMPCTCCLDGKRTLYSLDLHACLSVSDINQECSNYALLLLLHISLFTESFETLDDTDLLYGYF